MLTLTHVSKNYGHFTALSDISLSMENGLYGLLSPNGAGKTTLIKMITTLLTLTEGEILYNGEEIWKMGARYRDLIGYLPQQFGYYRNNTPVQYLMYLGALKGMRKQELSCRIDELLALVGLEAAAHKKMKQFSGGMLQRVGIAQAMLNDPKILVLDEPTAGLDPKERVRFRNIISALSRDRIVILSTHIVSDIESIANEVIMIKDKKLYCMDTVPNICKMLENKIFEMEVAEQNYHAFEQSHMVLSARQEKGCMAVRYYDETGFGESGAVRCSPNLEDVFLVVYQEEQISTKADLAWKKIGQGGIR
ncbi:MAG: ABC transporter ATP-binding protein [Lachnospiraceae bacterium]|nr:ABC transporter ATP-binding protein [Lachnospiraceae bacterium]